MKIPSKGSIQAIPLSTEVSKNILIHCMLTLSFAICEIVAGQHFKEILQQTPFKCHQKDMKLVKRNNTNKHTHTSSIILDVVLKDHKTNT